MDTDPTKKSNPAVTEDEYYRAEEALEQIRESGKTDLRCLRCGLSYVFEGHGSGYIIHCETKDCFQVTLRGI